MALTSDGDDGEPPLGVEPAQIVHSLWRHNEFVGRLVDGDERDWASQVAGRRLAASGSGWRGCGRVSHVCPSLARKVLAQRWRCRRNNSVVALLQSTHPSAHDCLDAAHASAGFFKQSDGDFKLHDAHWAIGGARQVGFKVQHPATKGAGACPHASRRCPPSKGTRRHRGQ